MTLNGLRIIGWITLLLSYAYEDVRYQQTFAIIALLAFGRALYLGLKKK